MKITVDTNFLISATQWDNSVCQKLLIKLMQESVEIFTTKEILDECVEVLERDFQLQKEESERIVEKLLLIMKLIETTSRVNIVTEDQDDNKIIECALDSQSEYIITYDKHLLKLKEYRGIRTITPEEARNLI